MLFRNVILVAATTATGLSAGLFYTFACAVMPGLARVDDKTFVHTMQQINVAIVNAWFMLSFLGALLLTVLSGILEWRAGERSVAYWIAVAVALYAAMLIITFALNIPLNDQLVAAGPPDQIADLAATRARFETSWVRWNLLRAVLATGSLATLAWAIVVHSRADAA